MTAANTQIIEAYETAGLTPEQIAEQFEWDIIAVKTILMQGSRKFYDLNAQPAPVSKESGAANTEEILFSPYEVTIAKNAIASLVTSSEDDHIKFRAAKFVIDEAKGRHDVKSLANNNFNITIINERMQQAKAAQAKAIEVATRLALQEPVPA